MCQPVKWTISSDEGGRFRFAAAQSGYADTREEPGQPYEPATVYAVWGTGEKEITIPLATLSDPVYREAARVIPPPENRLPDDEYMDEGYDYGERHNGDATANARLFAASAMLYDRLRDLVEACKGGGGTYAQLSARIAEAEAALLWTREGKSEE